MKVALMAESLREKMDGQASFTYHLAKNLSKIKDIDLTLIGSDYLADVDIETNKICYKKRKYTFQKLFFLDILKQLNAEHFDVIHCPVNFGIPYFWFVNALKVKNIHDAAGFEVACNYKLSHKIQLKTQFNCFGYKLNIIATGSQTAKKELIRHYHFPPDKIRVIYDGVDEQFRVIDKRVCERKLDSYNIPIPFIFHLSNGSSLKNIDGIISAYQKIQDRIDCTLVIGGSWKGKIKSDKILSAGYIPYEDLPYFYSGAELFVFPSFHEGFGLPVLEAMACGTPVITSNIYATKEIAQGAAVLVNPYNTKEIADAMYVLLTDGDRHEELRKRGLELAKKFPWKKCAQEYVDLYRDLINFNAV